MYFWHKNFKNRQSTTHSRLTPSRPFFNCSASKASEASFNTEPATKSREVVLYKKRLKHLGKSTSKQIRKIYPRPQTELLYIWRSARANQCARILTAVVKIVIETDDWHRPILEGRVCEKNLILRTIELNFSLLAEAPFPLYSLSWRTGRKGTSAMGRNSLWSNRRPWTWTAVSETHAPCIVCWPWREPTVSRAFL